MMYKAKVAVCSDIRTKHSTQSERQVEFLNVKPWWYVKKPPGFKRLTRPNLLSLSKFITWLSLPTFLRKNMLRNCKQFDGSTKRVERTYFLGLTIAVQTSIKNYDTINALHYSKFHRSLRNLINYENIIRSNE